MSRSKQGPGQGPYYAQVPHKLRSDDRIGHRDIALYYAIRTYADFGGGSEDPYVGGAFPGEHTLAEDLQMSRSGVRAARDRLVGAGWLSIFRRPGKSHVYFLHFTPLSEDKREFWTQETLELRKAWREGGARGLYERLEEAGGSVEK